MGFFSQLNLLLWKNSLLKRRKICVVIFEILLPVVFAALVLMLRSTFKTKKHPKAEIFDSTSIYDYFMGTQFVRNTTEFGYTPNTAAINSVMQRMADRIGNTMSQNKSCKLLTKGFKTENELTEYVNIHPETMQMALVFKELQKGATPIPLKINSFFRFRTTYPHQWKTSQVFPNFYTATPRKTNFIYIYTRLMVLQAVLTEALIEEWNNLTLLPSLDLVMQRTPYPPYTEDTMSDFLHSFLSMFLVLSFVLSAIQTTKAIVYEKEKGLKEAMKLMGLKTSVHWTSWFITCFVYLVINMGIYVLLFGLDIVEHGPVLTYSSATLFYVFLLCYAASLVSFCVMMSTCTQKANSGAVMTGITFFILYAVSFDTRRRYDDMSYIMKLANCVNFNVAMAIGASIIATLEASGAGALWSNFQKPATVDDDLSLFTVMVMLLIDACMYLGFACYIDNIWPGEFGVPKPFYFCFTSSYWCGSSAPVDWRVSNVLNLEDNIHFESDPEGLEEGIKICNLHKTFGTKVAVDKVSLRMYNEQITVLLGHNGAGKTTTMSMITGFIPPTSGTAYVNGLDIRKDIDAVRTNLGLCPQHNILFDSLTVKEHLTFFAKLKGCPGNQVKEEVRNMIKEMGLTAKTHAQSRTLSGGQKRKLCVGIALINKSKVVILDEPTTGMDPAARREAWEVLQRNRAGRTILLTTHHMDEADVLGDRIAIMAEGVVKCCGTSLFLKKLYGAGYHLVIVKRSTCKVEELQQMIQSCVPAAQFENEENIELTFLLPDDQSAAFPNLFRSLESQMEELGVRDFGATATTMEEVFLKVGESSYQETDKVTSLKGIVNADATEESVIVQSNRDRSSVDGVVEIVRVQPKEQPTILSPNSAVADVLAFSRGYTKLTGTLLILSQLRGMIMKKVILLWRQRIMTVLQLLVPVLFTIWALSADKVKLPETREPPLSYNLKAFDATIIPYASYSPGTEKIADLYKNQFGADQTTVNVKPPQSMTNFLLEKAKEIGLSDYRQKVIVGAAFNKSSGNTDAISYYSGLPYHARPISLAYTLNALAKYYINHSGFDIQMGLHPFPRSKDEEIREENLMSTFVGFSLSFLVCIGMAILISSFAHSLIKERAVRAKHMQMVCGANSLIFWLGNFIVDFINYLIPVGLLIVTFAILSDKVYVEDGQLGIVLLVLMTFGWAVLPFVYFVQFFFSSPSTGLVVCMMLNIVIAMMSLIMVFSIEAIPDMGDTASTIDWLFLVFIPMHNMGRCFYKIYSNYSNRDTCVKYSYKTICLIISNPCCAGYDKGCGDSPCIEFTDNYLGWESPGIGRYMLFMVIQGVVYMAFVLLVDSKLFHLLCNIITSVLYRESQFRDSSVEDDDVAAEKQRINASPASVLCQQESLLLVNLSRRFGTLVAVDHTCLGVPERECFGLLGQNGAGKTTTFRMLTGDELISGGNAYVKGYGVKQNITKVQANLGYCPQFDALLEEMTGRETLTMYARLRGVPETNIKDCVNSLMDVLLLRPHADNRSGNYSGGNKRKLSTGIALIGDPPIIMLDEPSSGMDPAARRQLWNVLSGVRASGTTMVLTSHSMEECEALCTRLAIMVNGRFMCLGSTQHLKSKFAQGYTLAAKMATLEDGTAAPVEPLVDYIQHSFPFAQLFDAHRGYVHMQITDPKVRLADVFEVMENSKRDLNVQNYNVHQTSLEQVFLAFTKRQSTPRTDEKSGFSRFCPSCC